jgi:hypothetical protein
MYSHKDSSLASDFDVKVVRIRVKIMVRGQARREIMKAEIKGMNQECGSRFLCKATMKAVVLCDASET